MDFETFARQHLAAGRLAPDQLARAAEVAHEAKSLNAATLTARLLQEGVIEPSQAKAILQALAGRRVRAAELVGRTLGPYKLVRRLGKGVSGSTYLAEHAAIGLQVAVKILHRTDRTERLREEAMRLAKLRHPNIVGVQDFGVQDDIAYLVMPFVEGTTLSDAALPPAPLAWTTLTAWMTQACRALAAVHAAGMIHRDVKPTNLLMGVDGQIRLIDFGLVSDSFSVVRIEGGTPGYVAPEQARGEPADARADLYGLGATFYALIAGSPPFAAPTPAESLLRQLREAATPEPMLVKGCPMPFVRVILRLLESDARNRFASAKELEDALATLHQELARDAEEEIPPPPPAPRRLSLTAVAVVAALLMTATLAVVAVAALRPRKPAPVAGAPAEPPPPPAPDARKALLEEAAIAERRGSLETALNLLHRAAAMESTIELQDRIAAIERTLRERLIEQTDFEKLQTRLANLPDEAAMKACAEYVEAHPKSRYADRVLRWKMDIVARAAPPPPPKPVEPKPEPKPAVAPPPVFEKPPAVKGRQLDATLLAGILWLARHQGADGLWTEAGSSKRCEGAACSAIGGDAGGDVGISALAVLAMLEAGFCIQDCDEYDGVNVGAALRTGVKALAKGRGKDGFLDPAGKAEKSMYGHAMALWAIANAVRTASAVGPVYKEDLDDLRSALQQGTEWLLAAQTFRAGWRYAPQKGTDTLVTAWAVGALEAARRAGMKVPEGALSDAALWITGVTEDRFQRVGYTHSGSGKTFLPHLNEQYNHHETTTAAGWLIRATHAPKGIKTGQLDVALKTVLDDLPTAAYWSRDYYYWFHGSRFVRHAAGEADFARWRLATLKAIDTCRVRTGCAAGSWDVQDRWSVTGGRVFATAINALTVSTLLFRKAPEPAPPPPPKPEVKPGFVVFLKSGGRLRATATEDRGDKILIQLVAGGSTTLARETIDRIEAYDPKKHD